MTKEDKELLLKDLSARLQYGVYIRYGINGKSILTGVKHIKHPERWIIIAEGSGHYLDDIKPYLRPMSSMTEEELKEYHKTFFYHERYDNEHKTGQNCSITFETYDWLNAHHFDYRGLIEKGLAIEAPEGMYN